MEQRCLLWVNYRSIRTMVGRNSFILIPFISLFPGLPAIILLHRGLFGKNLWTLNFRHNPISNLPFQRNKVRRRRSSILHSLPVLVDRTYDPWKWSKFCVTRQSFDERTKRQTCHFSFEQKWTNKKVMDLLFIPLQIIRWMAIADWFEFAHRNLSLSLPFSFYPSP